jgi:hypothetical protein
LLYGVDELGARRNDPGSPVIKRCHHDGDQSRTNKIGLTQPAFVPFIKTATPAARRPTIPPAPQWR